MPKHWHGVTTGPLPVRKYGPEPAGALYTGNGGLSYISDGPYKTYEWNSTKLEFKHRTNKEITGLSYMTSLVIQALKTLGRTNVTPEIIQTLSEKLSEAEKQACLKEATESTDWVYDTIRKMCGGDTQ